MRPQLTTSCCHHHCCCCCCSHDNNTNKKMIRPARIEKLDAFIMINIMMITFFALAFVVEVESEARESSSWLSLAPKTISKSELNFDNQALTNIPQLELCQLQQQQHQSQVQNTTTSKLRFIHVLSLANNQITQLEANEFVCVASVLKIL